MMRPLTSMQVIRRVIGAIRRGRWLVSVGALVALLIAAPAALADARRGLQWVPAPDFSEIVAGPDGTPWFSGDPIIHITAAGRVERFPLGADYAMAWGADGGLWIIDNDIGGLRRMTADGAYTTYPRALGMTDPSNDLPATSIVAGPDGNVWVGDREHRRILSVDHDGLAHVVAQLPRGSDPEVLMTDRRGDVWFNNRWTRPGAEAGYAVSRILAGGGRIDAARYNSEKFTPAAEDQGGNVWYVRSEDQLARIDPYGATTRFDVPLGYLNTVAVAPDGTVWAGGGDGLARLDDYGQFQPIRRATRWEVSSLYPAPDGRLWLTYFTPDFDAHAAWLPPNPCLSRRRITVHLRARRQDPILRATVIVPGRQTGRSFHRPRTVDIDLRGYLPGRVPVRIVITSQHRRYTLNRVFRTCVSRQTAIKSS